ncbi:MAG: FtsX-like permease family protein [Lachnospiraceae bacterium]|nr:FtsX-like permease family protein [Lachnospiraceae bacterium]
MLIVENILLALTGLRSNKMRTLLTMLGIIIGIASVISIMTVGNSLNTSIVTSMQEMGAKNLTVGVKQKSNSGESNANGMNFGAGFRRSISPEDYITDEMIDELKKSYGEQIQTISFSESAGDGTAQSGSAYANVTISGVNQGYVETNEQTILAGRNLLQIDQEKGKNVAVVSDKLVESIFGENYKEAVGNTVDVKIDNKYITYTIIGVYQYTSEDFDSSSDEDITTEIYIPYETAKKQNHSEEGYTQFTIVTTTDTDNETFMQEVKTFLNHYYSNNESCEISVTSMEEMLTTMTDMLSTISIAISIIAGISLLVGGIGVMNIMLVSITERTREIGTRKALGATNGSIRLQFIVESIVICVIGGMLGILLGIGIGSVASDMLGYSAAPSVAGILFSVGFSAFIGVFFGYYPANKAAKLNPIDALRYE